MYGKFFVRIPVISNAYSKNINTIASKYMLWYQDFRLMWYAAHE